MRRIFLTAALAAMGLTVGITADVGAQWYPNPVIGDTGRYVTDRQYDPWTGRTTIHTDRQIVRESALDPWRQYADPGSRRWGLISSAP